VKLFTKNIWLKTKITVITIKTDGKNNLFTDRSSKIHIFFKNGLVIRVTGVIKSSQKKIINPFGDTVYVYK
jgi:hypothetical protein